MKTAVEIIALTVFLIFTFVLARDYDKRNRKWTTMDDALDICGIAMCMFIVGLCSALLLV